MLVLLLLLSSCSNAQTISTPQVDPWGPNSFRVRWAAQDYPLIESTYTPFVPQTTVSAISTFNKSSDVTSYVNGNLQINVDTTSGLITVIRISDSVTLMQQTALKWAQSSCYGAPCPNGGAGLPPSAQVEFKGYLDTEIWFGGGEQGTRPQVILESPFTRDYADSEYYGYNAGRQAFIPLFFSTLGYGILNAQPGYGQLSLSPSSSNQPSFFNASSIRVVDFWFTTTPSTPVYNSTTPHPFLSLLDQYADAVGHAPLMPAFASGFIASKDRYRNQSQFLNVAHGYIDRNIPISMLTCDWFHWPELGDMAFKPECWEDPQSMVDELRALGIETMVTHWPFMSSNSSHRQEYENAGALAINATSGTADMFWEYLQNGALITTFSDATRALTEANWNAGYGKYGIRAMWLDETEPDRTGPADHALRIGQWIYEGTNAVELGPTWRQQWLRTMTGTLEHNYGFGNFFLLSRSAWIGTAKYGHAVWSGDTDSSWDELHQQISTMLGAGISGIGLWTSDLGGYSPTMQPFDPKLEELYVRWAQFASVSPLMRLHGHRNGGPPDDPVCMQTNGDNEPWTLFQGGESSPNYLAMVSAIRWREQKRNYVMDMQALWSKTNAPMCSPIWLLFPGDTVCAPSVQNDGVCADAFMFGTDYLVKPVTKYQQNSTWVWLPQLSLNQYWTNVFTGDNLGNGNVNITVSTPISTFPLFMRNYV
jgi:alpha-D-xyloside xylohydrolase